MNTAGPEQHIEIGADVMGSNGEKVGSVAYVVVRPPEMHITDIVVTTGAILGRDVIVPVDAVDRVAHGTVHLSMDKEGLDRCEDYVEVQYQQPPESWAATSGLLYPSQSMLWPMGVNYPQPASIELHAPPGTVGIYEGMEVESRDGYKVGSVDALDTDPATGNVAAILVKQGVFFTHDTRVPVDSIAGVESDKVMLNVTKDDLLRPPRPE